MAVEAGHVESTCLRDRGLLARSDWDLIDVIVTNDYTLVTRNAVDFRGSGADEPGGLHARVDIHAGLVCLDSARGFDLDRQRELFRIALQEIDLLPDLVNQALEVYEGQTGEIRVTRYAIP